MKAGVAFGSNLGDRWRNLRNARRALERLPGVRPPILASAIYETEPVECEAQAKNFLNAALEFEYSGEAAQLLAHIRAIEKSMGRPARHARNTSRTIDLDLLYFGETQIDTEELQLPHPHIAERQFVLRPLADINPNLVLPRQTEPVHALLAHLGDTPLVVRFDGEW
jgi:2-amino-4-hydroxy-6-hydroxymethyldihydropteridine diphosphokinase